MPRAASTVGAVRPFGSVDTIIPFNARGSQPHLASALVAAEVNAFRDIRNVVKAPGSNVHDEFVGLIIGSGQASPVHTMEGDQRSETQPLIAVNHAVGAGKGARQRRGLLVETAVGIPFQRARARTGQRRLEQPLVTDRHVSPEGPLPDVEEVRVGEIDHFPRRSSASA